MKISNNTIKILSNFATINPGIIFEPGNVQYTISPLNTIVCQANLIEDFQQTFAIYDLETFLKMYKAISDAALEFHDDHVIIKNDRENIKFYFADPQMIVAPKKKPFDHDNVIVRFPVENEIFNKIKSLTNVATFFKHLKISTREDNIILSLTNKDSRERAINEYDIIVGQLDEDSPRDFEFFIQMDTLKVLDGDSEFIISSLDRPNSAPINILRIENTSFGVKYWTSLDVIDK